MIEEQAQVIKISENDSSYAWVETERKSSCANCTGKSSCGTQVLSKIVGQRVNQIKVLNSCDAKKGDLVLIAIDDKLLLSGSFLLYFIPLMSMMFCSFVATLISQQLNYSASQVDINSIIFAMIGFVGGFLWVRIKTTADIKNNKNYYQATISRVLSTKNSVQNLSYKPQ